MKDTRRLFLSEALLLSQFHIIFVVIGLRMDVGLVLPSLGFSNVDVRKAELVLQATDLAKPVL